MSWPAVIALALAVPVILFLSAFLRAYTAKKATGKWPHEDAESANIYRNLP